MNIWTGLLFMEGAVADVSLARELSRDETSAATRAPPEAAPTRDASRTAPFSPRTPEGAH